MYYRSMAKQYSPSKFNTFDTCKLQYKYRYIDRLVSDITTIERFMGQRVHEALEKFYNLVKHGRVESADWLLACYKDSWQKNWTDNVQIVKDGLRPEDYLNRGVSCLVDYYERYHPFNQAKIISTEKFIPFEINFNGRQYQFIGVVDRLDYDDKNNIFEIHDYKTSNKLITQQKADSDWQLGLYHIAIKKQWPDADKIKLVWHFLPANKEVLSFRSEEQISSLKRQVINKINEIETCQNFYPQKSALCNWCDFQNICPLWKHPKQMEEIEINEYRNNPGVKLVAQYKKLEEQKNELKEELLRIEEEQEKISQAAIDFAREQNISIIDGPDAQLKVDIREEEKAPTRAEEPTKWEQLRSFLIDQGKYEEVSTVHGTMLNYRLRIWPADFIDKIREFLIKKTSQTVKLLKK